MKNTTYFITGIGTDVGKTIISAIITEALQADYWKPIQAGDLDNSDTDKVRHMVSNKKSKFHPNAYALNTPMSPHAAAEIDGVEIDFKEIKTPKTENTLVIEGAGGILVPISNEHTIIDLIKKEYKVIVVSRHYLGSINHTLSTIELLKAKALDVSIIFNGNEHTTTEQIITLMTNVPIIGRVDDEPYFDSNVVTAYADKFQPLINRQ